METEYNIAQGILKMYDGAYPFLVVTKKRSRFIKDVIRVLDELFESGKYRDIQKATINLFDISELYSVNEKTAREYIRDLYTIFGNDLTGERYAIIEKEKVIGKDSKPVEIASINIDISKIRTEIDKVINDINNSLNEKGRYIFEYMEYSIPERYIGIVIRNLYKLPYRLYSIKYKHNSIDNYIIVITA